MGSPLDSGGKALYVAVSLGWSVSGSNDSSTHTVVHGYIHPEQHVSITFVQELEDCLKSCKLIHIELRTGTGPIKCESAKSKAVERRGCPKESMFHVILKEMRVMQEGPTSESSPIYPKECMYFTGIGVIKM